MNEHRLALLIPTKNRRQDLRRLFDSLMRQSVKPDYLLLIDGGQDRVNDLAASYPGLPVHYLFDETPGLTRARNRGLRAVPSDMSLIGFLDDDIELFPDAIEEMLRFWKSNGSGYAGASFNIVDNIPNNVSWISRLFLVNSPCPGVVLPSGFHTVVCPVLRDTPAEWLSGGASVWRADLLRGRWFDEAYAGYGHCEDMDFSYRMGRVGRLVVLQNAKVYHHSPSIRPDKVRSFWSSYTISRFQFVRKFGFPLPAFWWATAGQLANAVFRWIRHPSGEPLFRALGTLDGSWLILTGRIGHLRAEDLK